jgi:hypothetical protein
MLGCATLEFLSSEQIVASHPVWIILRLQNITENLPVIDEGETLKLAFASFFLRISTGLRIARSGFGWKVGVVSRADEFTLIYNHRTFLQNSLSPGRVFFQFCNLQRALSPR